jgi:IMP dehydrogenase
MRHFTFDDVLLLPKYSDVRSRSSIDVSTTITGMFSQFPFLPANMDTIAGYSMCHAIHDATGLAILHRFQPHEDIVEYCIDTLNYGGYAIPSIGVQKQDRELIDQLIFPEVNTRHVDAICIDIAHGHCQAMKDQIAYIKNINPEVPIIAGNICTIDAFEDLVNWGASVVKVGVGNGAMCTTRAVTGCGAPQLSTLWEINEVRMSSYENIGIIADGGVKTTGDIVKALVFGADMVMTGFLFAGCDETPGYFVMDQRTGERRKSYRGMASFSASTTRDTSYAERMPEGIETTVASKGPVAPLIKRAISGIQSGLSYIGWHDFQSHRGNIPKEGEDFVFISGGTVKENGTI